MLKKYLLENVDNVDKKEDNLLLQTGNVENAGIIREYEKFCCHIM